MASPSLSILDQSIAVAGRPQGEAIRETLEMARHAEALGYARFWVSEHHNLDSIAGTAPEIVIAAIAATTSRIRVGSAGVLLPHYAALKVAEQFRVLDALAPGRIDLGVGRAPGGNRKISLALNPHSDDRGLAFPDQMTDLLSWVRGETLPPDHPYSGVQALPLGETAPEVWMLGSTRDGALLAARFGLPFCLAHFIAEGGGEDGIDEAFALYFRHYKPSARHPSPHAAVCVWALAAETEEEAAHLFATRAHWKLNRERNRFGSLLSPEAALAEPYTAREREILAAMREQALAGAPARVAARLREMARKWNAAEIVVLTWAHTLAARKRSYELLAAEFGLKP